MDESIVEADSLRVALRDITTDAIRYWEPRRLAYNGVLTVVALFSAPVATIFFSIYAPVELLVLLLAFVVVANVLYCSAYVVDVFVQLSAFREAWRRQRIVLFCVGTALAAVFTFFVCRYGFMAP